MDNKNLNYIVLTKTPKCENFYFNNENIYSFWNDYLITRINNKNILIVNRTGKEFEHPEIKLTEISKTNFKKEIKKRYCGTRNCSYYTSECPLAKDWGHALCNL